MNDKCNYYLSDTFKDKFTGMNTNLSLIHINSRSLSKDFQSITDYLLSLNHTFSIIGFSETWFSDTNTPQLTQMAGYTIVQSNRKSKKGGGVSQYVSAEMVKVLYFL